MSPLQKPIFLIGAARSGTTVTAELLAQHTDICYWSEPRYVWRYGNKYAKEDGRTAREASAKVSAHIQKQFARRLQRANHSRFLEKTPSNCFRIEFIEKIFPDALYIHLIRNGRDTAASAWFRWCSTPDNAALWRRLILFDVPWTDIPAYAPDALRELILRRLQPQKGHLWGPRYPGIHQDLQEFSTAHICARQWIHSVNTASHSLAKIPEQRVFTLRYDDLTRSPGEHIQQLLQFAQLQQDDQLLRHADQSMHSASKSSWHRLTEKDKVIIADLTDPVSRTLGLSIPS